MVSKWSLVWVPGVPGTAEARESRESPSTPHPNIKPKQTNKTDENVMKKKKIVIYVDI